MLRIYLDPAERGAHHDHSDHNFEHICATCLHNEFLKTKGYVSLDEILNHKSTQEPPTDWTPKKCNDTTEIVETRGAFAIKFQNECRARFKTLNRVPWNQIVSYVARNW